MARLSGWVAALLALVCASMTMQSVSAAPRRGTPYGQRTQNGTFATTTYWTPGTFPNPMAPWTLNYYLPEEITQVKGKTIMFQADFTIRDFADAVDFYCGFTNQNASVIKTSFGATGIRFSNQRPSSGRIKWGMSEVREINRVIWKFAPEGFAATVGKTYTVRAVVKVDPRTPYDSMYWRFFCEGKYLNDANGQYPFRIWRKVNLVNP